MKAYSYVNHRCTDWEVPTDKTMAKRDADPLTHMIAGLAMIEEPTKADEKNLDRYVKRFIKMMDDSESKPGCKEFFGYYHCVLYPTGLLKIGNNIAIFTDPNHKILTVDEIQAKAAITPQQNTVKAEQKTRYRCSGPATDKLTPARLESAFNCNSGMYKQNTIMYPILVDAMKIKNQKKYLKQWSPRSCYHSDIQLKNTSYINVLKLAKIQESYELPVETFESEPGLRCISSSFNIDETALNYGLTADCMYTGIMERWVRNILAVFSRDNMTMMNVPTYDKNKNIDYAVNVPTKKWMKNIYETVDAIDLKNMSWTLNYQWSSDIKAYVTPLRTLFLSECDAPEYETLELPELREMDLYTGYTYNNPDRIKNIKPVINKLTVWLHKVCDEYPVIRAALVDKGLYDGEWESDYQTEGIFKGDELRYELRQKDLTYVSELTDAEEFTISLHGKIEHVNLADMMEDEVIFKKIKEIYDNFSDGISGVRNCLNLSVLKRTLKLNI